MSELVGRRADTTREQLLRVAARQFARRPYHEVGLDEILAEADLTKGAMYFHFSSKRALALAVIEDQVSKDTEALQGLLARRLSGLENLVEISYLMAVRDLKLDSARSLLHLFAAVGRAEEGRADVVENWTRTLTAVAESALAESDLIEGCEPHHLAHVLVSLYLGQRQICDLYGPEEFLRHIEQSWLTLLPAIVPPERLDYFRQFVKRRTALAVKSTLAPS